MQSGVLPTQPSPKRILGASPHRVMDIVVCCSVGAAHTLAAPWASEPPGILGIIICSTQAALTSKVSESCGSLIISGSAVHHT